MIWEPSNEMRGLHYGHLKVLDFYRVSGGWLFSCHCNECGEQVEVSASELTHGTHWCQKPPPPPPPPKPKKTPRQTPKDQRKPPKRQRKKDESA